MVGIPAVEGGSRRLQVRVSRLGNVGIAVAGCSSLVRGCPEEGIARMGPRLGGPVVGRREVAAPACEG